MIFKEEAKPILIRRVLLLQLTFTLNDIPEFTKTYFRKPKDLEFDSFVL